MLWVNSPGSLSGCRYKELDLCSDYDVYQANASSTYIYLSSDFNATYIDGSGASGDYASDTILIGEHELTGMQFGIGYASSEPQGVLGIGYDVWLSDHDVFGIGYGGRAPSLLQLLVDQGVIQSNAYSLWLDDRESSTGSILFGGVDTAKFHGTLQTLPVQEYQGKIRYPSVSLTGLSLSGSNRSRSFLQDLPTVAVLDSGTPLTFLPQGLSEEIYATLGIQYSAENGFYASVDCSLAESKETLDFDFGSIAIMVPMNELVLPTEDTSHGCRFGIKPSRFDYEVYMLGDTFLRSAYVVYDLDNNQVSVAQTNFDATTSNIIEIGKGSDPVPGASVVVKHTHELKTFDGRARRRWVSGYQEGGRLERCQ